MSKRNRYPQFRKAVRLYRGASGSQVLIMPPPEWFENLKKLKPLYEGGEMTCVVETQLAPGYDDYPGCNLLFYPGDSNGKLSGAGLVGSLLEGTQRGIDVNEILYPETPERLAQRFMNKQAFGVYVGYDNIEGLRNALTKALRAMRANRKVILAKNEKRLQKAREEHAKSKSSALSTT